MTVDLLLPNGLRLLVEPVAQVRTVSVGIWFPAGSRDDPPGREGAAHLLEHLVFKGSGRRGARALAEAMDALGGQFNAFTTREHTCFHARTLGAHLTQALELLAELVVAPRLDESDAERERQVVLDELAMIADDPGESADESFGRALWGDHPLGRPEAGTTDSVRALRAAHLAEFHRDHYTAAGGVLAAAGRVDPERLLGAAERLFAGLGAGTPPVARAPAVPRAEALRRIRASEQAHVVLGTAAPGQADEERWAAALLAAVLGGSASSRLFQAVREERGLCYDVGAACGEYSDTGELVVFLSSAPELVGEAVAVALGEIRALAAGGVPAAEFARQRGQLLAGLWMGLESTEARMMRLGRQAVAGLPLLAPRQVAARLRAVTRTALRTAAERLGDPGSWAAAYVGPRGSEPSPWAWTDERP